MRDLTPDPLGMPTATIQVRDRDGDGKFEIALHGGAVNSAGAGIVQTRTEYYAWSGSAFALVDTVYDPSPYRVHVFFDGDRALRKGNLPAALARYRRVAADRSLKETGFGGSKADERRTLEAFAYYRLVTVYAARGNRTASAQSLSTLRSRYAGHPVVALAQAFYNAWQGQGNMGTGCQAATAYAQTHAEVLESFGEYGYGNPPLEIGDICFLQ